MNSHYFVQSLDYRCTLLSFFPSWIVFFYKYFVPLKVEPEIGVKSKIQRDTEIPREIKKKKRERENGTGEIMSSLFMKAVKKDRGNKKKKIIKKKLVRGES